MAVDSRGLRSVVDLEAADKELLQAVDTAMAAAARRAGPLFRCGPGRTDCCHGPFPINLLDARRLQQGLADLARRAPARARSLRRRAQDAVARLSVDFPGDPRTGLLHPRDEEEERFCARHARLPCAALDPKSGLCELYAFRPLACRTMGPPVRLGGRNLPPCPFCFGPASPDEIAGCRADPDPEGREDVALDWLEAQIGHSGETFIPHALLGLTPLLP